MWNEKWIPGRNSPARSALTFERASRALFLRSRGCGVASDNRGDYPTRLSVTSFAETATAAPETFTPHRSTYLDMLPPQEKGSVSGVPACCSPD